MICKFFAILDRFEAQNNDANGLRAHNVKNNMYIVQYVKK